MGERLSPSAPHLRLDLLFESPIRDFLEHGQSGIWELVLGYASYCCFDARDKVFALLALADWEGGRRISPDYTLSVYEVAQELIMFHPAQHYLRNTFGPLEMSNIQQILGHLGLGFTSESITHHLLERRQLEEPPQTEHKAVLTPNPSGTSQEACQKRNIFTECRYCILDEGPASSLRTVMHPPEAGCEDESWIDVTQLEKRFGARSVCLWPSEDLQTPQLAALVPSSARPGDILLDLLDSADYKQGPGNSSPAPGRPGLLVRCGLEGHYLLIGQVLFNPSRQPCGRFPGGPYECQPGAHHGYFVVRFDLEDLMVFLTQDLVSEEIRCTVGGTEVVTGMTVSAVICENLKRLETAVPSPRTSSNVLDYFD
jgi:hypothetical protein